MCQNCVLDSVYWEMFHVELEANISERHKNQNLTLIINCLKLLFRNRWILSPIFFLRVDIKYKYTTISFTRKIMFSYVRGV